MCCSLQHLPYRHAKLLASCHGKKLPDPGRNSILAICVVVRDERNGNNKKRDVLTLFRIGVKCPPQSSNSGIESCASENEILDKLAALIVKADPDVLAGFETQNASVGFLLERASVINHPFSKMVSRELYREKGTGNGGRVFAPNQPPENAAAAYFRRKGADVTIKGRHVLNLWRIVRKEVKLACYSAEGVALELLRLKLPKHTPSELEAWLARPTDAPRTYAYLCQRAKFCVSIVDKLDILGRTGELARVFGVDFMSVLTRGSQFRVESMLARVAHARDFVLLSAQREQVFGQPAVESLPLVMEPMSALYVDPVIVLDFQSLYPSMIIAHNLCFSTMMGNINRIRSWSEARHLGVVQDYVPPTAKSFGEDGLERFFVAPNGEMFVTAEERRGVLPQMLDEVLTTRVMVKNALKGVNDDEQTARLLNARQFGLKMIANVTYGYASASFSGRMPCANLADAIVQCGRDALERIVQYVDGELQESTGASVVYGDTDSIFVKVPGATKQEAFEVGGRIVEKALTMFPVPVRLQLEKIYHPCVLLTKKRYVGYAYESGDQAVPVFDAKGIETVRRDSCALVQTTMEQSLRILFETRDISRVKRYVQRVCQRVIANRLALSNYIFRKEVRLGSYKEGHMPPAAIVASRAMEVDPRAAPRYGERVAFVVIYEKPGSALKDSVVTPEELLHAEKSGTARLNATYYITKQILPALDRVMSLIGVKVATWYAELPRPSFAPLATTRSTVPRGTSMSGRNSLYRYYTSERCVICHRKGTGHQLCVRCTRSGGAKRESMLVVALRTRFFEERLQALRSTCVKCIGVAGVDAHEIRCVSLDCPISFAKHTTELQLASCRQVLADDTLW